MREAKSTAQRMETQLVQKEQLFEDKIKVGQHFEVQTSENFVSDFLFRTVNPCQSFLTCIVVLYKSERLHDESTTQ